MPIDLPSPDDPLFSGLEPVQPDRTDVIDVTESTARSALMDVRRFKPARPIYEDQLPSADQDEQLGVAALLTLRLLGMDLPDIAEYTGKPLSDIENVFTSSVMQSTYERVLQNIVSTSSTIVQGRITGYANRAVTTVVELMENEMTRDDVRLKAAQDVLDRSGTNAEQFFAQDTMQQGQEDDLQIVYMDDADTAKARLEINLKRRK
jgi:hypothetical protein